MAKKDKKETAGSGKYIVIEKIKEKLTSIDSAPDHTLAPLTSTSLLLEGIHFSLVYFPLTHLGYKSVVSSLSGIYGKGGVPETISVNLAISTRHNIEDIESVFEGIDIACKKYSLKISDISVESSLTGLTLSTCCAGKPDSMAGKNVKPAENDLVCVTGDLGSAYMGLNILERERKVFEETGGAQPLLEGYEFVIARQLKPDFPVNTIESLNKNGIVISSIGVTNDGISSDMIGRCRDLGLGCRIYIDKVPIAPETEKIAEEFGLESIISALNGGDDFELLFTVPISESEKVMAIEGVSVIGHLTGSGDGCNLVLQDGSLSELRAPGWEE